MTQQQLQQQLQQPFVASLSSSSNNFSLSKAKSLIALRNQRPSMISTSISSVSSTTSKSQLHMQPKSQQEAMMENSSHQNKSIENHPNHSMNNGKRMMLTIGASLVALTSFGAAILYTNPAIAATMSASAVAANNWISSLTETGFYQAFSLVFVSEIGDKTFFIAGLLAMKTSKFISFLGSMGALVVMTIISVVIGQLFHAVPSGLLGDGMSIPFDDIAAVIAFAFFGIKILRDAIAMDDNDELGGSMGEELEEAKQVVDEQDTMNKTTLQTILGIFTLVFAAEFGDRSFISTIALSAAQNPISVAGGAIAAHAFATGIAVSGGSVIAKYLSEKVIGIIGGTLFIVFAITTALGIF
jgi:putative Ca2+/H+ antiporter (TMEM165/GDT1 family)